MPSTTIASVLADLERARWRTEGAAKPVMVSTREGVVMHACTTPCASSSSAPSLHMSRPKRRARNAHRRLPSLPAPAAGGPGRREVDVDRTAHARAEALALAETLERSLELHGAHDGWEGQLLVYDRTFSECLRQVDVQCAELGALLQRLRAFYVRSAHAFLALCKQQVPRARPPRTLEPCADR